MVWRPLLALSLFAGCFGDGGSSLDDRTPRCNDEGDPTTLNSSAIEGHYMHMNVSYGGGCEPHAFLALWSGQVAASDPPSTYLYLHHVANDDACDAWITEDLYFDLRSMDEGLLQGGPGPFYINGHAYTPGQDGPPPPGEARAIQSCDFPTGY